MAEEFPALKSALPGFRQRNRVYGAKPHMAGFAVEGEPKHPGFRALGADLKPEAAAVGITTFLPKRGDCAGRKAIDLSSHSWFTKKPTFLPTFYARIMTNASDVWRSFDWLYSPVFRGKLNGVDQWRKEKWRRGWDSNPRDALTPAGFQDRCLQPLGHLSDADCLARE